MTASTAEPEKQVASVSPASLRHSQRQESVTPTPGRAGPGCRPEPFLLLSPPSRPRTLGCSPLATLRHPTDCPSLLEVNMHGAASGLTGAPAHLCQPPAATEPHASPSPSGKALLHLGLLLPWSFRENPAGTPQARTPWTTLVSRPDPKARMHTQQGNQKVFSDPVSSRPGQQETDGLPDKQEDHGVLSLSKAMELIKN